MQCTVSGIVSNLTPGTDTLSKIEIVWLPTDTNSGNLQARATAETIKKITITDATALSNFASAGTTVSSANIVSGNSYIFAVRATETRNSTNYPGVWNSTFTPALIPTVLYYEDFNSVTLGNEFLDLPYFTDATISLTGGVDGGKCLYSLDGNQAYFKPEAWGDADATISFWCTAGEGELITADINGSLGLYSQGYNSFNLNAGEGGLQFVGGQIDNICIVSR